MHLNPLDQFKVIKIFTLNLFGTEFPITNSDLSMITRTVMTCAFLLWSTKQMRSREITRIQSLMETLFRLTTSAFQSAIGHAVNSSTRFYSKYVFSVFLMILSLNLFSMVPGSFAPTGQFAVTLAAGTTVMIITLALLIQRNGLKFLGSFIPHGTPAWMAPMIFILEVISFLIRPVSLCVRLGANIIAGHVMLEVLASLAVSGGLLYGPFAFLLLVAINILEFGVVCLQAYIFASLSAVYLGQATQH